MGITVKSSCCEDLLEAFWNKLAWTLSFQNSQKTTGILHLSSDAILRLRTWPLNSASLECELLQGLQNAHIYY